jgi:hypothetical protein
MMLDMIHAGNPLIPRESANPKPRRTTGENFGLAMPRAIGSPKASPVSAPRTTGMGMTVPKANVDVSQVPMMHKGGTVKADGVYGLKAGEHVLTASEAAVARKHALMFSGLKSLAKSEKPSLKKES